MEENINKKNDANPFGLFFNEKAYIGSHAMKAEINFLSNNNTFKISGANDVENDNRRISRMYYFSIRHAFKNIDTKKVFKYEIENSQHKMAPTRFKNLQPGCFNKDLIEILSKLIHSIRNICSHYAHVFNEINMDKDGNLKEKFIPFLKDAFELAVMQACGDESGEASDEQIVDFLRINFLFNTDLQMTKSQAIERTLFINVDETYPTFVGYGDKRHELMKIEKGKYLSFYACLFLLTMFLYRDEAVSMISGIRGFKKNSDSFSAKRNVYTFFAKKPSSRDVDNEETPLVKFRDIIQYLSHYPTAWNDVLLNNPDDQRAKDLLNKIVEMEIKRIFPEMFKEEKENAHFMIYAKNEIFSSLYSESLANEYIKAGLTSEEEDKFSATIERSHELTGERKKLNDLLNAKDCQSKKPDIKRKENIRQCRQRINELENNGNNAEMEKIEKRINDNLFIQSYGRNKDRFMQFAVWYLAETNYFGGNAMYEIYQFNTSDEQHTYLKSAKTKVSNGDMTKKEYDALRVSHGRIVTYVTYKEIANKYSLLDDPFVYENNAIQVYLPKDGNNYNYKSKSELNDNGTFYIIQRSLIVYLLEHCLYSNIPFKYIIKNYKKSRDKKLNEYKATLSSENVSITAEQSREMSKLLPKRLLHHYMPDTAETTSNGSALFNILNVANEHEKRYNLLHEQAKKNNTSADFDKKNKGKQFKLNFVWKAWNRMYFADMFRKQVADSSDGKNHKRFNVTRDEFNDFSRWMYAFDEVPQYKEYLRRLFAPKLFFEIKKFKDLFEKGNSLNDYYASTKELYKKWADNQLKNSQKERYTWSKYDDNIINGSTVCINLHTFINKMKEMKLINCYNDHIQYESCRNAQNLVDFYYLSSLFNKEYREKHDKTKSAAYKKLYNSLNTSRLEDTLLYEIAMQYLKSVNPGTNIDDLKRPVVDFFNSDICFGIYDSNNTSGKHLYNVAIPFNKIEAFGQLLVLNKKSEYLQRPIITQLKEYLSDEKYSSAFDTDELKAIRDSFINVKADEYPTIRYNDMFKVIKSLKDDALQMSRLTLLIEKYAIANDRDKKISEKENEIDFDPSILFDSDNNFKDMRDSALHFNIPPVPYKDYIRLMEMAFINKWIKSDHPTSWNSLNSSQQEICNVFMKCLYNYRKTDAATYYSKVIKELL